MATSATASIAGVMSPLSQQILQLLVVKGGDNAICQPLLCQQLTQLSRIFLPSLSSAA